MTAAQLAQATGRNQSNLKKKADELVREGALEAIQPSIGSVGQPGPRPKTAFAFSAGERKRFEEMRLGEDNLGVLEEDVHLVVVDAKTEEGVLSEVLAQADVVNEAAWSAFLDGEQPELTIAFRGSEAVEDSRDLMAILSDAKLKARRASVANVHSVRDLVRSERRRKQRVERNRAQRQAPQQDPNAQA